MKLLISASILLVYVLWKKLKNACFIGFFDTI